MGDPGVLMTARQAEEVYSALLFPKRMDEIRKKEEK